MSQGTLKRMSLLSAVAMAATSGLLIAGPLNPPAGPVAPTMKTLVEIEPRTLVSAATTPGNGSFPISLFTISQPGSYYLASSIQVPADKVGIKIACNDVTLDLNGFTVSGGLSGVHAYAAGGPGITLTGITVKHGTLRGSLSHGVAFGGAQSSRLQDLTVFDCDWGIDVGDDALVVDCIVRNCDNGIETGARSVVRGCTSTDNSNVGILVGDGSAASGCLAAENDSYGFILGNGSSITNAVARNNGSVGIGTLQECVIADCAVQGNVTDGIATGQGCIVRNCTAGNSGRHGITAIGGTSVEGCTARANGEDGINATWQCRLVGNTCMGNGATSSAGAGIRVTSWGSRIEDNTLFGNDKGMVISGTDNVIVRNTSKNSTVNFDVIAGNELAPIVNNPGSTTYSTATPWSNFAY